MYILNIAKHFDSRAPLDRLRDLAYNYNINESFIHVLIIFHRTHLPVSALAPKRPCAKTARRPKAGAKKASSKRWRQKLPDPLRWTQDRQCAVCNVWEVGNIFSLTLHAVRIHMERLFSVSQLSFVILLM